MTTDLVARFEKRFVRGPTIDIDFAQSTTGFSVTALIGPSGCGKTTMLRCLAGLTMPDKGSIQFCDRTWFDSKSKTELLPQQRDIGFLFQDYALFPHLTVEDNIGFALLHQTNAKRRSRVAEIVKQFDLTGLEHRFPAQLSGGQQQRVALGRVLARRPKLLLLDEPLSALYTLLREQLRVELRQMLSGFQTPVILVTHDRVEAISLADRVAVMDAGKIEQIGSIQDVFSHPKNAKLARLVGVETVLAGEIVETHEGLATVRLGSASILAVAPSPPTHLVHVCIRGEDVSLSMESNDTTTVRNRLPGIIKLLTPEGPLIRVGLDCGFELTALITRPANEDLQLQVGNSVTVMIKAPAIHLIPRAF